MLEPGGTEMAGAGCEVMGLRASQSSSMTELPLWEEDCAQSLLPPSGSSEEALNPPGHLGQLLRGGDAGAPFLALLSTWYLV